MKRSGRSLLFGLIVALVALSSLWLYFERPQVQSPKDLDQPLLCWSPDRITGFEIERSGQKIRYRRGESGWVSESAQPVDQPQLEVQLAQLRQTVFRQQLDLEEAHSGVKESQDRWIFELGDERCSLIFGLVNQVTGQRLVRREHKSSLLGSVVQKSLLRLDWDLAADRLTYLDPGGIKEIHLQPEVTQAKHFVRVRGHWTLEAQDQIVRADAKAMKELLAVFTQGLVGTWLETAPDLTEPDLQARVVLDQKEALFSFFHHESGYLARDALGHTFRLNQNPLMVLRRSFDAYRDLRVIHYERGQVGHFVLVSASGRVRYDRRPQDQGPDHWYEGKRSIKEAYRLAALQWDLHSLRAKRYLGPPTKEPRVCLDPCRQVLAVSFDGETMVDLKLWPAGEDLEVTQKDGNRLLILAKDAAHWPFQAVP